MHVMTIDEARSFLRGQDRRHRQGWEQTRLLGGLVHKVLTGQDWEPEFPWDDETAGETTDNDEDVNVDDYKRLRGLARVLEDKFNAAKGNL